MAIIDDIIMFLVDLGPFIIGSGSVIVIIVLLWQIRNQLNRIATALEREK